MTFGNSLTALATAATLTMLAGSASADPLNFKPLTLINGWTAYAGGTRAPSVALDDNDIVHFRGAIANGSTTVVTVLPPKYRPKDGIVYVVTNLINAAVGRIVVQPDGTMTVSGTFASAQGFTSLEGVNYSRK